MADHEARLAVLGRTLELPDYFMNEIYMLGTYLTFIHDLVEFLSKLPSIPELTREKLREITKFIQEQIDGSKAVLENIPVLRERIDRIALRQHKLVGELPPREELAEMMTRINSWPASLDHLLDGYGLGLERNPDAEQLQRLTAIDSGIKEDAETLRGIVSDLSDTSNAIVSNVDTLIRHMDDGIGELQRFSPQGYILPEMYLDKMETVAKILHQLDTIFEPLLLLIEVLNEKEHIPSGNSILDIGKQLIVGFAGELEDSVETLDWMKTIEAILGQLSPINNILKELDEVSRYFDEAMCPIEEYSFALEASIKRFIVLMNTEKSYKFQDKEISNRFFTQAQVESAAILAEEIA